MDRARRTVSGPRTALCAWCAAAALWVCAFPAEATPPGTRTHTVEEGEAVWTIARAYGVSLEQILRANPELDPARVRPGDELRIVGATRAPRSGRRAHGKPGGRRGHAEAKRRAQQLGLGTAKAAAALYSGHAETAWVEAAGGSRRLPGNLHWPVAKGWFVRGFGSGSGGYHQAIDIGGEIGWHVRAAESGLVAYAGNEVSGFGNLVILVHPGGWITLYGHNRANRVRPGERVRRGQVIAELGSTGLSKGPHVHFELLFDGENCNPATLFRPGVRDRDGTLRNIRRRYWSRPRRKPRAIECHPRKHHPGHRT